ncbi:MAG: hypothetical protein KBS47_05975 [Bacteroidales bacterium]|nr:hypothetical protein [Candidatus Equimonas enterica]
MSDGNFNRNLLPYNNYQSGLRAGMSRMKTQALQAVEAELAACERLTEAERAQLLHSIKHRMDAQ